MKLLDKYNFDWDILQTFKGASSNSIFLNLCKSGSVDCMRFFIQHCGKWIDFKGDLEQGNLEQDINGLSTAVIHSNEAMVEYLLREIYVGDNSFQ